MLRPRCSVFIACSLDGFIAREDGGVDWLAPMHVADEDYGYQDFFGSVDAVILGKATYEAVLGFPTWPYADKRCVVLTHGTFTSRYGEEFHAGPPAPMLERLAREGVARVYVDGGSVIRAFLAAGFIDDLTISIVPVLLGVGRPLFGPETMDVLGADRWLRLRESRAFPSGLVRLTYGWQEPED